MWLRSCISFLAGWCALPVLAAVNPFAASLVTGEDASFYQEDPFYTEKLGEKAQYRLDYTRWLPSPETDNGHVIIYNHGLQSHRGWYNATAEKLKTLGYSVYAFDRIGSGTSSEAYAQDGWYMGLEEWLPFLPDMEVVKRRGHIREYQQFLQSIDKMVDIVAGEHPNKPIHLWGNSYGAKIVTRYLLDTERCEKITSSIFTTPGLFRDEENMPLTFSKISLFFSKNADVFPTPVVASENNNGAHWFTSDEPWVDYIRNDFLSLRTMTRKMAFQTLALDMDIEDYAYGNQGFVDSKRLYLLVNDDVMMDNGKMLKHIADYKGNSEVKFYQGGDYNKHFLAFTQDADNAINDIDQFLRQSK